MKKLLCFILAAALVFCFASCGSKEKERVRPETDISENTLKNSRTVAENFIGSTFKDITDFEIIGERILLKLDDDLPYGVVYSFSYGENEEGFVIVKFDKHSPFVPYASLDPSPYNDAPENSYLYYEEPYGIYYQLEDSYTFNSLHEKAASFTKEH